MDVFKGSCKVASPFWHLLPSLTAVVFGGFYDLSEPFAEKHNCIDITNEINPT